MLSSTLTKYTSFVRRKAGRSCGSLLEDELAEIFLLQDLGQAAANVGPIDDDPFFLEVGTLKAHFFHHPLEDRVQPAGADVLRGPVHLLRDVRQSLDAVASEVECHAFRR